MYITDICVWNVPLWNFSYTLSALYKPVHPSLKSVWNKQLLKLQLPLSQALKPSSLQLAGTSFPVRACAVET